MPGKSNPEKPVQRRNRQPAQQRKHEIEMARIQNKHEFAIASLKYVMEDFDTQLLVVALTGTGIATAAAMYEEYVASFESPVDQPDKQPMDFLSWAIAHTGNMLGGVTDGISGAASGVSSKLQGILPYTGLAGIGYSELLKEASNKDGWHGVIGTMISSAQNVAGLAWALLFARAILGEAGLGGVLGKAGDAAKTAVAGA